MGDFLDDGFVESVPVEAPAVAPDAEYAAFGDEFVAVPEQAPLDNGNGAADDFFSSAAPTDSAAVPLPADPVLEAGDPRVAWVEQNRVALRQREAAEAAKKVELLAAAKEHLDKVYKARDVQLSQRNKSNREAEAVAGVAEGAVPKGNTPWERVISVCSFNSEALSKDPFKEMSRYKAVLLAAKSANISVGGA